MPLTNILEIKIFDVWSIDFMRPFPQYFSNPYIHVIMDYVSKWIEALATPTNDFVTKFLTKYILSRHGTPREIISDEGTHFCNKLFENLMAKYEVKHKVNTTYHPQSSGQAELSNREIKVILEKVVNPSRNNWSKHLDDSLWVYRTSYKTPLGMFPSKLVYGKDCHMPIELELKVF